jgi:hypothetical protein
MQLAIQHIPLPIRALFNCILFRSGAASMG